MKKLPAPIFYDFLEVVGLIADSWASPALADRGKLLYRRRLFYIPILDEKRHYVRSCISKVH